MVKNKWLLAGLIILTAFVLWLMFARNGVGTESRPVFAHADLTITRADGTVFSFKAEIANSPAEQAYGLMYVKSLAADAGMIFPYNPPQQVAFWMKNTLIPLDMLFISPDGSIGRIIAEAPPLDLTPIPSQIPVIAVIEIAGGMAKKDGLAVGDKVNSPALNASPQ